MKKLNRYASISTIYGFENYKGTQINIFILQLQYIWPNRNHIFKIGNRKSKGKNRRSTDKVLHKMKIVILKCEPSKIFFKLKKSF